MLPGEVDVDLEEPDELEEPADPEVPDVEDAPDPGLELKVPVEELVFGFTLDPATGLFSKVPASKDLGW